MEKVSVIVPVYNTSAMSLQRCIGSILEQTYSNLEILIVDDGNPESYQHNFDSLESRDPRIKVIHQQNSGVSGARNTGLKNATGRYISFIDSDDYIDCAFYVKMVKAMQGNDVAICGVDGDNYYPTIRQWCDRRTFFSKPSMFIGVQYVNFPCNKLYRSDILKQYGTQFPLGVKLGEDALFLADYYAHCNSFEIIPDKLYYYMYSPESAVNSYCSAIWDWEKDVIQKQWDMFHQYPLIENEEKKMRAWLYYKYRFVAYYYLEKEPDRERAVEQIRVISAFPLLKKLSKCGPLDHNDNLTQREKISVFLFNRLGARGTMLSYRLRK